MCRAQNKGSEESGLSGSVYSVNLNKSTLEKEKIMYKKLITNSLLLVGLLTLAVPRANAQNCAPGSSCPANATGISANPQVNIVLRGTTTGVTDGTIGACQELDIIVGLQYQHD